MARIAVDLDGVVASTLKNGVYPRDYPTKECLPYSVEALTQLRDKGHTIYFFTARYEEDRAITAQWLWDNGFAGLYDELIMGKPKYDIIIDDRALRHSDWQDTLYQVSELDRKGVYHNDNYTETVREEAVGSGGLAGQDGQLRGETPLHQSGGGNQPAVPQPKRRNDDGLVGHGDAGHRHGRIG